MAAADVEKLLITRNGVSDEEQSCPDCCCFSFIERLLGLQKVVEMRRTSCISQAVSTEKKLLVLDLDETLVHASFYKPEWCSYVMKLEISGVVYSLYIQMRPGVKEFLKEVQRMFTVIIFTASLPQYANPVIDLLIPGFPKERRFYRSACTTVNHTYVKDLRIFGTPLEKVIIVDNNPCSFMMQPENAILSKTWEGDKTDRQLMQIILPLLKSIESVEDVRKLLANDSDPEIEIDV